jgi:hypothetical protein
VNRGEVQPTTLHVQIARLLDRELKTNPPASQHFDSTGSHSLHRRIRQIHIFQRRVGERYRAQTGPGEIYTTHHGMRDRSLTRHPRLFARVDERILKIKFTLKADKLRTQLVTVQRRALDRPTLSQLMELRPPTLTTIGATGSPGAPERVPSGLRVKAGSGSPSQPTGADGGDSPEHWSGWRASTAIGVAGGTL